MLERDLRGTDLWQQVEGHFTSWLQPGFGRPHGFADVDVHPSGQSLVATASFLERLEGVATTRLVAADADGLRMLTVATSNARSPRHAPDGATVAFLSDRQDKGVFQLLLLRPEVGEAASTAPVDGVVEYLDWSPDGRRILLGVAGKGADVAGGAGSGTLATDRPGDAPDWLPQVSTSEPSLHEWRRVWVHDVHAGTTTCVSPESVNVWDARWCGPDRIAVVATDGDPREGGWYRADVRLLALDGTLEALHKPTSQLGVLAANPTGTRVAVVEAICSDRGIAAGEVRLIDVGSGRSEVLDTLSVDVTDLGWVDDHLLGWCGLRGLETVHGTHDLEIGKAEQRWATNETTGQRDPQASWALNGAMGVVWESYQRPPCLAIVRDGQPSVLATTESDGTAYLRQVAGTLQEVTWTAPDGLELQGLLTTPEQDGPHPLVVMIHGGPVWAFRNRWAMGYDFTPLLVKHGYAVLHPNPRGSTGRGREFVELVVGDMGGRDTQDLLSGVDELVARGIADPDRVGLTGGSYGGYMTAWLVTQDPRFSAAVAMAPVTDWYSQHHASNIPHFDEIFLDGQPTAAGGLAHARSPVMFADKVVTPTLLVSGALDRCTPPSQATEFLTALVEAGVESACAIYPGEGHGVRGLPGRIDVAARMLGWFQRHMPS